MHTVQITNISVDELVDRMRSVIPAEGNKFSGHVLLPGVINVLNKRDAARTLNISESLFDKLHRRGIIPCTVNAGISKKKLPIRRWAEHHLLLIKPEIQKLKYRQNDEQFERARKKINQMLGL